ncbi:LytTR family DNA-binding domain-containing protein [Streptococcus hyointestinalis]|uniref:LytTR family DNA-binding domain-containing protein n=1 Tax=Streptococcus hyointestinalis TaxID=1337 RepID=UPI003517C5F8
MKITIELDDSLEDVEVVIRTSQLTPEIESIKRSLEKAVAPPILFYRGNNEFYVKIESILFFETDGSKIYAHAREEAYEVKLKLYELEEQLPHYFCRISKSTIVNTREIYALDVNTREIYALEKSFSGTSTVRFYDTKKQVHVSRHYYHMLKEKLHDTR